MLLLGYYMRSWRNWQTHCLQAAAGDHASSSLADRTIQNNLLGTSRFFSWCLFVLKKLVKHAIYFFINN